MHQMHSFAVYAILLLTARGVLADTDGDYGGVFEKGQFSVQVLEIHNGPAPAMAFVPMNSASDALFPVMFFHHGTRQRNSMYSTLLTQIASHGFIVVAPQLQEDLLSFDATAQINSAATFITWALKELTLALKEIAVPDLSAVSLSGHSRGGKVAFALSIGLSDPPVSDVLQAVIGFDPVDGLSNDPIPPPIVTRCSSSEPHCLKEELKIASLLIGSGLGDKPKLQFMPACAPAKLSHCAFFKVVSSPAYHFTVKEYGHSDFLNDGSLMMDAMCTHNPTSKDPMRQMSAGLSVAFLKEVQGSPSPLNEILADWKSLQPAVEEPETYLT